jgi:hypothetical protein
VIYTHTYTTTGPGPMFSPYPREPGIRKLNKKITIFFKALEIPLDAKCDGEQLCYYGSTPDFEGNDVKMAFKVRVVLHCIQAENT